VLALIEEGAAAAAAPKPAGAAAAAANTPLLADSDGGKDAGKLSPSVRRLVEENHLDPAAIPASGRDGRLTKSDVVGFLGKRAVEAPPATAGTAAPAAAATPAPAARAPAPRPAAPAGARTEQRVPMTRLRARIAQRLIEAQSTQALLTTFNEVDLGATQELRALQGALREGARREAGLHVVLRQGRDRGAEEVPGAERLGRRRRHHLSRVLRHRRRRLHRPRPDRADRARRRRQELRGDREGGGRLRPQGARGLTRHRGSHRRHLH